jgi:preprotein translocase subunit Sss1
MSDGSRPKENLKKIHTVILVLSKPSLNPFIVIFL